VPLCCESLADLGAERLALSHALRSGSAAPLGDLTADDFFDGWHTIIVRAIRDFGGARFTLSDLARTLPLFLAPYLHSLILYGLSAELGIEATE
jgi:hypothetical protein